MYLPRFYFDYFILAEVAWQLIFVRNKYSAEEAYHTIFSLKQGKLTRRIMEDAKCINSNLVKFFFGMYQARMNFDSEDIIHSMFDSQTKIIHVPTMENFWEDCIDELEVKRRVLSRFSLSQIIPFQLMLGIHIIDIEDDGTNILTSQKILPVNTAMNWDSKEEDDIFKIIANVFKMKKSWFQLKKGIHANVKADSISNISLHITGSRRPSKILEKKVHKPPLVQKNYSNKKAIIFNPASPHQVIQVDSEQDKDQEGELIDNSQRA